MKLVIQIPCLNEESVLPQTLADLPRQVRGVDEVEILVIDDGSRDRTVEVARAHGVHRVAHFPQRRGLARAFAHGLLEAIDMGADIIVNTDADNQYKGSDIERLIQPIMAGQADMVIGARTMGEISHFSPIKKLLQGLGSWVVRQLSHTQVPDATSGFRAYSREAALRLTIVSDYTYTLETIIQATKKNISIAHIPISVNPKTRESRLIRSIRAYIGKSVGTMARVYVMYQPLKVFAWSSVLFFLPGLALVGRFLYFYFVLPGSTGHVQSLVIGGVLCIIGFILIALGVIADLIALNRRILDETLTNTRINRFNQNRRP